MAYVTEVANYLDKKGAIELVIEVPRFEGARYTDLEPHVPVSSTTLSKRLAEGVQLTILELNQRPVEYGTEKLYKLARLGGEMYDIMKEEDIVQTYYRLKELREQYEEKRSAFLESADQSPGALSEEHSSDNPWYYDTAEDYEEYNHPE